MEGFEAGVADFGKSKVLFLGGVHDAQFGVGGADVDTLLISLSRAISPYFLHFRLARAPFVDIGWLRLFSDEFGLSS